VPQDLKWIFDLSLPDQRDEILALEPPAERLGPIAGKEVDFEVLSHLRHLWLNMGRSTEIVAELVGDSEAEDGDSAYWRAFGKLGSYYAYLACRATREDPLRFFAWLSDNVALAASSDNSKRADTLTTQLRSVLSDVTLDPTERRDRALEIRAELNHALAANIAIGNILSFDRAQLGPMIVHAALILDQSSPSELDKDAYAFEYLATFNQRIIESSGAIGPMLGCLMRELLAYGEYVFLERAKHVAKQSVEGALSSEWLEELTQLSRRTSTVAEKYGEKKIEGRFERHLALLFQTFGFSTVPAVSGEPAADLLCIARDGSERFTFLVDAKSSKKPYAFPKADQRAMVDYVRETARSLSDLPPLRFALIVGNGPAKKVEEKLAKLEAEVGLPLRFVDAEELADFRRQHNGLVRSDFLLDMVLNGGRVVATEDWEKLLSRHGALEETYAKFVRDMRSISLD